MPQNWKSRVPFFGEKLAEKKLNLGLDLAGGSQLDFKIDLSRVREKNAAGADISENAVAESVVAKLHHRADPSGTRELNVFASDFNVEKHVVVELTADVDTPEMREKLAKNIDLQFRKKASEEFKKLKYDETQNSAKTKFAELESVENFAESAKEFADKNDAVEFSESEKFRDEITGDAIAENLFTAAPGEMLPGVFENEKGYTFLGGQLVPNSGFSIFKITKRETVDREKTEPGKDFAKVSTEISEAEKLEIEISEIPADFADEIANLETGKISEVLENDTEFAIFKKVNDETVAQIRVEKSGEKLNSFLENTDEKTTEVSLEISGENSATAEKLDRIFTEKFNDPRAKVFAASEIIREKKWTEKDEKVFFEELFFRIENADWEPTELDGSRFARAKVAQNQFGFPIVSIEFDDEGKKLFEKITEENINQPLAIFVGGQLISAPTINEKIAGGAAQISTGERNFVRAKRWAINLTNELNTGAIDAPVKLIGETKVEASLGANALRACLFAGAIGLFVLAIGMISVYRLMGIVAVLALGIYAVGLVFILKFFDSFVLTLAGIAGIILSIGMAVDANILIFERIREELRDGKNFASALETGFDRAWSSIRDSNLSSLITCGILYLFGTSIVKGFAVMLAVGILLSMLTAISVSKTFLQFFVGNKFTRKV